MIIEFHRFTDLLDHTVLHDNNAVRHCHSLHLIMCYIDRSSADLSVKLADLCSHADTKFCVKIGQRLIHQEYFRILNDRTSQRYPLALSAGEVFRLSVTVLLQSQDIDRPVHLLLDLVCRHLHILQAVSYILLYRHMRVQSIVLKYHGDSSVSWCHLIDFLPIYVELASCNLLKPCDHSQRR